MSQYSQNSQSPQNNQNSQSPQYSQNSKYHPDLLPITEEEIHTPTTGKRNRCYGGILYRQNNGQQYLLVKGRQTGIWSFPKGHSIKGETPYECAKREIREETGLHLKQEPLRVQRLKGGIYFVFDLPSPRMTEEDTEEEETEETEAKPEDNFEIEENRWVTREEMEYLIVNAGVKDFLQRKVLLTLNTLT